jgi:tRNA dimethylallyltransferase
MKENGVIFVVGPTAVGKTQVAFKLAQYLNGEIVSCDAMQVYKEITIASSKAPRQLLAAVTHHLIDEVSVCQEFDVATFNEKANAVITDIQERGRVAIVTGGSGLYMQVLLDGIFKERVSGLATRKQLQEELQTKGEQIMYQELSAVDPLAASKIHPHDARRIIRALEVYQTTGERISELQQKKQGICGKYPIQIFALTRPRAELYQRIDERVDEMFEVGLVEEIKAIKDLPLSKTAGRLIGVREVSAFLNGECDLPEAKSRMKQNTRHYAKRQLTWFRKEKRLQWIEITSSMTIEDVVSIIQKELV